MDSNDSLLYQLVDPTSSEDGTNTEFKTAMQNMQIDSVFDIVSMSLEDFANALALHSAADAQQIYDKAVACAHMISRLYYEQQVSPDGAKQRNRRDADSEQASTPITYQSLFNENWSQFCREGNIAANNSPVAYLRALYQFARELENSSTHSDKVTLEQRRPDLPALMLDVNSTFDERPMLSIVNDTLKTYIQQHLDKTNNKKTVQDVLASEHYPLQLPYDLHHQQCLLALGEDKPALGELNYQVSLELPFSRAYLANKNFLNARTQAQHLLSGLSPEQQKIWSAPYNSDVSLQAYGPEGVELISSVKSFKELSGLNADEFNQLLAQGKYAPKASIDNVWSVRQFYGSSFINMAKAPKITADEFNFKNLSIIHLDRVLRIVRLQRWTNIPFVELDTLIISTIRSELGGGVWITANILRSVGVYRYLNKHRQVRPEEFAAILWEIPVSSSGDRVSLFDEVFSNTSTIPNHPLNEKYNQDIDVENPESQVELNYLRPGIGLTVAHEDLLFLARQTKKYRNSLQHNLSSISSIYRQARIAQMFGLSPLECTDLARLLGGEAFCKSLVTGAIKAKSSSESDILDVLMAMDWAVDWLKKNNYSVKQWCRLLDKNQDELALNPELEDQIKAVQKSPHDTDEKKILLVQKLLHDVASLSREQVPCAMKLAETFEVAIFNEMTAQTFVSGKKPPLLARALRATEAIQALLINNASLLKLLNNPAWLAHGNRGTLTPHTLYLLDRFSTCTRHHVQAETRLLNYFEQANRQSDVVAINNSNTSLAELLNWTIEEVSTLTADLPHQRARSMEEVDWVIRCKNCCEETGLSVNNLKLAALLNTEKPAADWKTVGEALIAAHF